MLQAISAIRASSYCAQSCCARRMIQISMRPIAHCWLDLSLAFGQHLKQRGHARCSQAYLIVSGDAHW